MSGTEDLGLSTLTTNEGKRGSDSRIMWPRRAKFSLGSIGGFFFCRALVWSSRTVQDLTWENGSCPSLASVGLGERNGMESARDPPPGLGFGGIFLPRAVGSGQWTVSGGKRIN